jgi:hypothetical protein
MVIREGGVDPNLVTTIHLRAAIRSDPNGIAHAILAELNLRPGRYLLYPANFWHHKNHELLFTAFGMARQQGLPPDVRLVCTGTAAEQARQGVLANIILRMGLGQHILLPGYLNRESVACLLTNSAGIIFPSLFEGFGLPIAEAMAAGVPVACSNVTSLPEIAGEAALLFDPHVPEDVAHAMIKLVSDQDFVRGLVALGRARAAPFARLDGLAERYLNVFEKAARAKARNNMLTGVASDGWLGATAKLRTVAAEKDRHLRLNLSLPSFVPFRKVSVRVRHGGRTLARISINRGSSHTSSIALPRAGALIELSSWPSFVPAALETGIDDRELSIIVNHCAIIEASGDQDVLFP